MAIAPCEGKRAVICKGASCVQVSQRDAHDDVIRAFIAG
jgi:hypothetical protein